MTVCPLCESAASDGHHELVAEVMALRRTLISVQNERDACAALADEFGRIPHGHVPLYGLEATAEAGRQIANAIRNRDNER